MGHAPAMTIGTYTPVIRELKGEPIVPEEAEQRSSGCGVVPGDRILERRARVHRIVAGQRDAQQVDGDVWGPPRRRAPVRDRRGIAWFAGMARPGLEPGTPGFSAAGRIYSYGEKTLQIVGCRARPRQHHPCGFYGFLVGYGRGGAATSFFAAE
jgi:hypothetical protein